MNVCITGASGFLGSHIAERFRRAGHHVCATVRPTTDTRFLRALEVELRPATLADPGALRQAVAGADVVIHVAARVHTHGFWREFVADTIRGADNTLRAAIAANVPRFIQLSTVGVYGFPRADGAPYDETHDYGRPYRWNYYSRAKIAAEQLVRAAHQRGAIATSILRPTWIYGPRDSTTFDRLAAAIRAGRLKWIGDGANVLSLVYVTDVAEAAFLAATRLEARGQIYNVATDEPGVTQERFIRDICAALDLAPPTARLSYAAAHRLGFISECVAHATAYRLCPPITRLSALLLGGQRRYRAEKLQRELGWRPAVYFADGLRQTLDWHRGRSAP